MTEEEEWDKRPALRVLEKIRKNPGRDGVQLSGLVGRSDIGQLRDLEKRGFITFRHEGWFLTMAGDLFLAENSK